MPQREVGARRAVRLGVRERRSHLTRRLRRVTGGTMSFRRWDLLTALGLVAGLAMPIAAKAAQDTGERGLVTADLVDLRSEPKDKAKSKVKLSHGTMISATGHSPDGQWVQVKASVEHGPDTVDFEGWIQKKY